MRAIFLPTIASLAVLALCACDDGSDGDEEDDTDNRAACQAACEAEYAEELADCDACGISVSVEGDTCNCTFHSCLDDLCDDYCDEIDAGTGGSCQIVCVCS